MLQLGWYIHKGSFLVISLQLLVWIPIMAFTLMHMPLLRQKNASNWKWLMERIGYDQDITSNSNFFCQIDTKCVIFLFSFQYICFNILTISSLLNSFNSMLDGTKSCTTPMAIHHQVIMIPCSPHWMRLMHTWFILSMTHKHTNLWNISQIRIHCLWSLN